MITLSSLPKSKWQNLLNLETIKVIKEKNNFKSKKLPINNSFYCYQKHNKPKEPPKKAERAPFFLPTLPGVEPKFVIAPNSNEVSFKEEAERSNSKIMKSNDIKVETEFVLILKRCHELRDCKQSFISFKIF